MITTEASSTTMSWATAMMASARKRLGSRRGPGPVLSGRSRVEVMASPSPGKVQIPIVLPMPRSPHLGRSGLGGSDGLQSEPEYGFLLHYTEHVFRLSTGEGDFPWA